MMEGNQQMSKKKDNEAENEENLLENKDWGREESQSKKFCAASILINVRHNKYNFQK